MIFDKKKEVRKLNDKTILELLEKLRSAVEGYDGNNGIRLQIEFLKNRLLTHLKDFHLYTSSIRIKHRIFIFYIISRDIDLSALARLVTDGNYQGALKVIHQLLKLLGIF